MIAGLPWTAWLLVIAAVGLGLTVELVFFLKYRNDRGTLLAILEGHDAGGCDQWHGSGLRRDDNLGRGVQGTFLRSV